MYTMKQACKKVGRPLLSLLAVAAASLLIYWWHILSPYIHIPAVTNDQLDALDLSGYTKILFSAHPDDELIWGGGHLLDDKYLVVCMTGGNNPVRSKEFQSVVTEAGGKYLMLSYPDKLGNKRSSWKYWRTAMEKDVATILNYKDWQLVATHNENGEYGHQHHQMTHQIIEKDSRMPRHSCCEVRVMQLHDILLLRTSAILPEAISAGGLTPTTDTSLLLTTYRGGSHLPADIKKPDARLNYTGLGHTT